MILYSVILTSPMCQKKANTYASREKQSLESLVRKLVVVPTILSRVSLKYSYVLRAIHCLIVQHATFLSRESPLYALWFFPEEALDLHKMGVMSWHFAACIFCLISAKRKKNHLQHTDTKHVQQLAKKRYITGRKERGKIKIAKLESKLYNALKPHIWLVNYPFPLVCILSAL